MPILSFPLRLALAALLLPMSLGTALAQTAAPLPAGSLAEDLLPGLKPILAAAISQSPAMISESISVLQAESSVASSRSSLLPNVGLSSSYNWGRSATADTENIFGNTGVYTYSRGFGYGFGISQPLFHWGALKAGFDSAKLGEENARLRYADAYRQLALTLREQYLGLIHRKMALEIVRRARQLAAEALALRQDEIRRAVRGPGEVNGPLLNDMDADQALKEAELSFGYAKRVFSRLAGIPEISDTAIPNSIPRFQVETAGLGAGFTGGPAATLQARIYSNSVRQSELSVKRAKTGHRPKFSVSLGYNLGFTDTVPRTGAISSSAVIGMSLNLFDGFATRANVRSNLAAQRAAELQLRNYVESTREEFVQRRQQVVLAGSALAIAEKRREFAEGALDTQRRQVGAPGGPTPQDIVSAEFQLSREEAAAAAARASYLSRSAEYISIAGTDPVLVNLPPEYRVEPDGR